MHSHKKEADQHFNNGYFRNYRWSLFILFCIFSVFHRYAFLLQPEKKFLPPHVHPIKKGRIIFRIEPKSTVHLLLFANWNNSYLLPFVQNFYQFNF